jgi:tRNA(Arg) A34 adenosine deaminase TadA
MTQIELAAMKPFETLDAMATKMEAKHPFFFFILYTTLQYCRMCSGLCEWTV